MKRPAGLTQSDYQIIRSNFFLPPQQLLQAVIGRPNHQPVFRSKSEGQILGDG